MCPAEPVDEFGWTHPKAGAWLRGGLEDTGCRGLSQGCALTEAQYIPTTPLGVPLFEMALRELMENLGSSKPPTPVPIKTGKRSTVLCNRRFGGSCSSPD